MSTEEIKNSNGKESKYQEAKNNLSDYEIECIKGFALTLFCHMEAIVEWNVKKTFKPKFKRHFLKVCTGQVLKPLLLMTKLDTNLGKREAIQNWYASLNTPLKEEVEFYDEFINSYKALFKFYEGATGWGMPDNEDFQFLITEDEFLKKSNDVMLYLIWCFSHLIDSQYEWKEKWVYVLKSNKTDVSDITVLIPNMIPQVEYKEVEADLVCA